MDTSNHHKMRSLFEKLGLASEVVQISQFFKAYPLARQQRIELATFWTPAQAAFIEE